MNDRINNNTTPSVCTTLVYASDRIGALRATLDELGCMDREETIGWLLSDIDRSIRSVRRELDADPPNPFREPAPAEPAADSTSVDTQWLNEHWNDIREYTDGALQVVGSMPAAIHGFQDDPARSSNERPVWMRKRPAPRVRISPGAAGVKSWDVEGRPGVGFRAVLGPAGAVAGLTDARPPGSTAQFSARRRAPPGRARRAACGSRGS